VAAEAATQVEDAAPEGAVAADAADRIGHGIPRPAHGAEHLLMRHFNRNRDCLFTAATASKP
jgi:hypothetical protein